MQSCEEKPPTRDWVCIEMWNFKQDLENRMGTAWEGQRTQDKSGEVGTPAWSWQAWFMKVWRSAERARPGMSLHYTSPEETRHGRRAPWHNKGYIGQTQPTCTKWRKSQSVPTKIGTRTRVSTLSTPMQHGGRSLSRSSKTGEADKSDTNRKEVKWPYLQMMHICGKTPISSLLIYQCQTKWKRI